MKKIVRIVLTTCILMLALSPVVRADHAKPPADNSSAELKQIKSLAGRWTATTSMFGKKNQKVFTEYQVTAGGSAVLETIFPGTPQEMASVYYDDNGKLAMTHYCIMRNRPTFKLAKSTKDTFNLKVVKVEGLKSKKDPSMGDLTMVFKDNKHYSVTCNAKNMKHEKPMTMEWTRVKSK